MLTGILNLWENKETVILIFKEEMDTIKQLPKVNSS